MNLEDLPEKPGIGDADSSWKAEEYYRARLKLACELFDDIDTDSQFVDHITCEQISAFLTLMKAERLYESR
jgi:hypothetical protein